MTTKKQRHNIGSLAILILLIVIVYLLGRWSKTQHECNLLHQEEVVEVIDEVKEVTDTTPIVRDSVVINYVYVDVPVTPQIEDTIRAPVNMEEISVVVKGDSASVQIPITQKVYETEDYRAYISGYQARMDSIFFMQHTTTIKVREPAKKKRFSVGVQAGYGFTPKGFQPYVGIGVAINLASF